MRDQLLLLGATAAALTVVAVFVRGVVMSVWRCLRRLDQLTDQWFGDPQHAGVLDRLGNVDGRLEAVEARLGKVEARLPPPSG